KAFRNRLGNMREMHVDKFKLSGIGQLAYGYGGHVWGTPAQRFGSGKLVITSCAGRRAAEEFYLKRIAGLMQFSSSLGERSRNRFRSASRRESTHPYHRSVGN